MTNKRPKIVPILTIPIIELPSKKNQTIPAGTKNVIVVERKVRRRKNIIMVKVEAHRRPHYWPTDPGCWQPIVDSFGEPITDEFIHGVVKRSSRIEYGFVNNIAEYIHGRIFTRRWQPLYKFMTPASWKKHGWRGDYQRYRKTAEGWLRVDAR